MIAGLAAVAGSLGTLGVVADHAHAQQPRQAQPGVNANNAAVDIKVDKTTGALIVPLGGFGSFDPGTNKIVTDVKITGAADVVEVQQSTDPKKVTLVGRLGGATRVVLTFADNSKIEYSVLVQPDYELLRTVIRRAVPTATVDVIPGVGNVIILSGSVSQPGDADTIVRIASSAVGGNAQNVINALQVGGSQHVTIDVTIAQVDRTELRERGFAFGIGGATVNGSSVLGGLATNVVGAAGAAAQFTPGANANVLFGIVPAQVTGALRALKTEGLAKFLSETKLTTQTGRPGFIRAGGQQAILSPAAGINGPGVILAPVGTELEVLPIVYGNGKIYLELNPRVSSVNNGRGIGTAFGFTPGFNEQQTRSSVMLESGQTFAIGGLLETQVQASAEKVPYLGDLPLLGAAFSNVRHEERETELLILVTPRLVEPLDSNQVPRRVPGKETRSVDDYELFLESLLEAPRGPRPVWLGRTYNAAYKQAQGGYPGASTGNVGTPVYAPYPAMTPAPVAPVTSAETPVLTPVPTGR
jgi:pilus assembly protein CpaC